jgi:hypothetical protein
MTSRTAHHARPVTRHNAGVLDPRFDGPFQVKSLGVPRNTLCHNAVPSGGFEPPRTDFARYFPDWARLPRACLGAGECMPRLRRQLPAAGPRRFVRDLPRRIFTRRVKTLSRQAHLEHATVLASERSRRFELPFSYWQYERTSPFVLPPLEPDEAGTPTRAFPVRHVTHYHTLASGCQIFP